MAKFQRKFDKKLADKLKEEALFDKLKADCEKGVVFPAVRGGCMSFYYKGGSLFKYDKNGFSTHIKYAFVPKDLDGDYVTQEKLESVELEDDFVKGYAKIQERCMKYARDESKGVSNLYKDSSVSKKGKSQRYYLVDIEVALSAENNDNVESERETTDRIDILLYDNEERQLLFCEAKHFSNPEIRAKEGHSPKVVEQMDRYNRQIKEKNEQIVEQYTSHFSAINNLFGTSLNLPESVYERCGLLIFGFDEDQKRGRLEKHLLGLSEHKYYPIGGPKNIFAQTLYEELIKIKK